MLTNLASTSRQRNTMNSILFLFVLLFVATSHAAITRQECIDQGGVLVSHHPDVEVYKKGFKCEDPDDPLTEQEVDDPIDVGVEVCRHCRGPFKPIKGEKPGKRSDNEATEESLISESDSGSLRVGVTTPIALAACVLIGLAV